MSNEELWQAALGELELSLSKASFTTWFKNTAISLFENNSVVISVPNTFTKTWLEQKYNNEIKKTLKKLTGQIILDIIYKVEPRQSFNTNNINIIVAPPQPAPSSPISEENKKEGGVERKPVNQFGLNSNFTFESYIVGKGNELAHAACQAVAARPGQAYNPLYLYGDAGLGKTHLMHAVGNEVLKRNPGTKVIYVTCEKFANDYISSVRERKMDGFRNTYRSAELLLIDDIQFLVNKEGTQEEFFHTYNSLHQTNRQIIITADRAPKAIPDLEDRLRSRLEWGMVADIALPDLETRIAILEAKCQEKKYLLDKRVLQYIALNVQNNIRELEGVLTKIIAFHQLRNIAPSFEIIKNIVSGFAPAKTKKNLTIKTLVDAVCEFYNLDLDELMGKTREKRVAEPRQILMYLMREELKHSYPSIGKELGGRDHTTVMHAYGKISKETETNIQMKQEIENIKQSIYSAALVE